MTDAPPDGMLDCVIVGGGIHGTHLAGRLLEDTELARHGLAIVDPNDRLLASFRRKANACGMDALRSTYVQHVGTEPFGLESFAEATGREDELRSTVDYPDRPSLDLFLDHADRFIDANGLESLHTPATVEGIQRRSGGGFRLTTSTGRMDAAACVLAIGHGGRLQRPEWAHGVERVTHVWRGFDPGEEADHTVVIGGGITAVQLASTLSERESVTMVSRHPIEWAVSEADPPWLNWNHIERKLHRHPRASEERLEVVRDARHSATVPPHLYDSLDERIDVGCLRLVEGDVADAVIVGDGVSIVLEDGEVIEADRVVCATGFDSVFQHPLVDRIATELALARGFRGIPLLDDTTLAWETIDGDLLPLYVSGALALATVGPYAPNVPGAKRAADRITRSIGTGQSDPEGSAVRTFPTETPITGKPFHDGR